MNIKLTVILTFCCAFFLHSNFLFSQDSDQVNPVKESMLKKGIWAIVFELGTYNNFFEAFSLTAKIHLSDRFALRLSAGTNIVETDGNSEYVDPYIQNSPHYYQLNNHDYSFQTTLNLQYFLSLNHKIKPFISVGPYANYSYNGYINNYEYRKIEEWGIGFFSSFGVEMFILDNISLIGEYVIRGTYGKNLSKQSESSSGYYNYSYSSEYKLNFKTARLGFSVYF